MQLYPGIDPFSPIVIVAGKGVFPTPSVMTGADLRNAANLMAAVQAVGNRTNFLAWRMIDIISGGSYNNGPITFGGNFFYQGITTIDNGGTLQFGSSPSSVGHLLINRNSTFTGFAGHTTIIASSGSFPTTWTFQGGSGLVHFTTGFALALDSGCTATLNGTVSVGGNMTCNGTVTLNAHLECNSTVQLDGAVTRTASETRSGAGAGTFLRTHTGTNGDDTFDPSDWDVIIVPALSGLTFWNLTAPAGGTHQAVMIFSPDASFFVLNIVDDASGVTVAVIDQTTTQKQGAMLFHTTARGWRNVIQGA